MKKVLLGKIIESTVEEKYKYHFDSDCPPKKLNLGEYYKTFQANHVGQLTTYDIVGKRDYGNVDKLIKKC